MATMEHRYVFLAGGVVAIAVAIGCHYPNVVLAVVFVVYSGLLVALTIGLTVFVQHLWNAPKAAVPTYYPADLLLNVTRLPQFDRPPAPRHASQLPILFGRTVDGVLQQLLAYTLRDFVQPWLRELTRNPRQHADVLREDIWLAVQELRKRAQRIDAARLLAVDMTVRVTVHLEKIRIAQARAASAATPSASHPATSSSTNNPPPAAIPIATAAYLATEATELEFLRKLCEIAAIYLLPRGYSLSPLRQLLSEMLAHRIVQPLVHTVSAPDFLNQHIVHQIETRLAAVALRKRCYEYAASFEDFVRVIGGTQSVDELLLMRTSCVNDILKAQTQLQLETAAAAATAASAAAASASGSSGAAQNASKHLDDGNDGRAGITHAASSSASSSSSANASAVTASAADRQQLARLRRYVQQLTYAKSQCERHLRRLGWTGAYADDAPLPLADVLATVTGRRQFGLFLEPLRAAGLIGFQTAVEELRAAPRSAYHQLGAEIFYAYIRAPAAAAVPVTQTQRQRMEAFLLGDQGPEVFHEAQAAVLRRLQEQYYGAFVLSAEYETLRKQLAEESAAVGPASVDEEAAGAETATEIAEAEVATTTAAATAADVESASAALDVANHSTYARTKLDQLQERLDNKAHALAALRASLRPESKLLGVLGGEVEWLRMEKRQLEAHLRRTELWADYLGAWRASVQSVEMVEERDVPHFMILVQVDEELMAEAAGEGRPTQVRTNGNGNGTGVSSGWVVLRSLNEFHELHRKLRPLCGTLKTLEPPTMSFKLFVPKNDRASLEKAKAQIQRYLTFILEEDVLYQSEAIYSFLSPSSENLKQQATVSPKKSKFSLLTLFKPDQNAVQQQQQLQQQQRTNDPFWGPCGQRDGVADISTLLDGSTTAGPATATAADAAAAAAVADDKDSIAEPLYALMGEIFDMGGGVFKWLRRSLISFVQITYGRTINRQIRDTVTAAFEEPQLHAAATAALKCLWPGGVLAAGLAAADSTATGAPQRSEDTQQMTATAAASLLADNMPEWLCNLVGAQTARRGAQKVWLALQCAAWNRQLFYELLEIVFVELFPETRQLRDAPANRVPTAGHKS